MAPIGFNGMLLWRLIVRFMTNYHKVIQLFLSRPQNLHAFYMNRFTLIKNSSFRS